MTTSPQSQLILIDKVRQALAEARTIDEVKIIRDQAETVRYYFSIQSSSLESQNYAAEIKLRAERRLGEMLADMEMNPGTVLGGNIVKPPSDLPKLEDFGILKIQSHRWQLEREVPEERFEQFVAEIKEMKKELTSVGLTKLALGLRQGNRQNSELVLPEGVFDVALADPPWQYEFSETDSRSIEAHYPTLSVQEICSYRDSQGTPIQEKFAPDAVLFLWATQPKLREALVVMEAWGFEYRTGAVWVKEKIGMGYYFREQHELLLVGKKGDIGVPLPENRHSSVIMAPRLEHSAKPEKVYDLIETMYPRERYLDVFAAPGGKKREKWVRFGIDLI